MFEGGRAGMALLKKLGEKWTVLNTVLWRYYRTTPAMETIYRDLFLRDLKKFQIEDHFYPVGGAANHGLFYLIARCFGEFDIRHVLELGAGQTSILLSQINAVKGDKTTIRTVEHDPAWAGHVQQKVSQGIHVAKLVAKTIEGQTISHYQAGYFDETLKYDFVLIDGPPAYSHDTRMNRVGALEIHDHLADDFIVIIDDAERPGEDALVGMLRRALKRRGVAFQETALLAGKRQHVFCGGAYARAAYF